MFTIFFSKHKEKSAWYAQSEQRGACLESFQMIVFCLLEGLVIIVFDNVVIGKKGSKFFSERKK